MNHVYLEQAEDTCLYVIQPLVTRKCLNQMCCTARGSHSVDQLGDSWSLFIAPFLSPSIEWLVLITT